MSVATMTALGIARNTKGAFRTLGVEPQKAVDSAMEKIAAFIPSEVIGVYVVALGMLSPQRDAGKWLIFGICIVLVPIFICLDYVLTKKRNPNTKLTRRVGIILAILGVVAFVAWAAAMPGTPFLSLHPNATAAGGVSVMILAAFMYKIAEVFDLVPKVK